MDQIQKLQKQNNKLLIEVEEKRSDCDKFKALQGHSNQQQILLNKLKAKLDEYEYVRRFDFAKKKKNTLKKTSSLSVLHDQPRCGSG